MKMKLKWLSTSIVILMSLLFLSGRGNAQEVYGSCLTNAFIGEIRGYYETNGQLLTEEFNFSSQGIGPTWSIDAWGMTDLVVTSATVNKVLTYYATITAEVYFTGGKYKSQPAIATVTITQPSVGTDTVGFEVVDYFSPYETIFTSGSTGSGSGIQKSTNLIQLKDKHGSWFLEK